MWMGAVEQQLGEKPPRTPTWSLEENPRPAVPHIQASWAGPKLLTYFSSSGFPCYYYYYYLESGVILN